MPGPRRAVLAGGVLAVAAAGVTAYLVTAGGNGPLSPASGSSASASEASGSASASGAGASDVAAGTTHKVVDPPPKDPTKIATDTATPSAAVVQITYAGVDKTAGGVGVGAYVPAIIEDGGTCQLTLTRGGMSVTATSAAHSDATTTSCAEMVVPSARVAAGTWQADVAYTSPGGHASTPGHTTVVVP